MSYREKPFISAIVYMQDDEKNVIPFFEKIHSFLVDHFEHFEIIMVDDFSKDLTFETAQKTVATIEAPASVIRLSKRHGYELAFLAGLDKSIGDYVYKFESTTIDYDLQLLNEMFQESKKGYDIVVASPNKNQISSSLFYNFFNRISVTTEMITTERIMLITRRALNGVLDIDERVRYMKALLLLTGFSKKIIYFNKINDNFYDKRNLPEKIEMAFEILISYSKIGFLLPLYVSTFFLLLSTLSIVYVIISYFFNNAIVSGWASTVAIISFLFFGMFFILGLISQYVSKIAKEVVKIPMYTIEKQKSNFNQ